MAQLETSRELVRSLQKRINASSRNIADAVAQAREAKGRGDRSTAVFHLKRKRMLADEQQNMYGQMLNLTKSIQAMEQSLVSSQTLACLKGTTETLTTVHTEHDVDEVADDFDDACELSREFCEQMSTPIGDQPRDDDVLDELDALGSSDVARPSVPPSAPSAPSARPEPATGITMPVAPETPLPLAPKPRDTKRQDVKSLEALMC